MPKTLMLALGERLKTLTDAPLWWCCWKWMLRATAVCAGRANASQRVQHRLTQ